MSELMHNFSGIIDAHVHFGRSLQGHCITVTDLLYSMDTLGIMRSVLIPVRPLTYDYLSANEDVAQAVAAQPNRFWGLGRIDPRLPNAVDHVRVCLEMGLRGIYLHPWEDCLAVSDTRVDAIATLCQQRAVPLMIATGYPWVSEALQVAELARRFPELTVIMTHGGQINISGTGQQNVKLALARHDNLYITTSGVYREDFLEEVMTEFGSHRVLFGSDCPIYDQAYELHRVLWAHVPRVMKQTVLCASVQRLMEHPTPQG